MAASPKKTNAKSSGAETPEQPQGSIATGVTLADHVESAAAAIDTQLGELNAQREAVVSDLDGASKAVALVKAHQLKTLDGIVARLSAEKDRILGALENLPAEIHGLEARLLADLKNLF